MESVQSVSLKFILLAIFLQICLAILFMLVLSPGEILRSISVATGFLINGTLLNSLGFVFIIGTLFWKVAGLQCRDLAIDRSKLLFAILWITIAWSCVQFLATINGDGGFTLDPSWQTDAISKIGRLIGQMFGNALWEEIFWRAFLLSQLTILLQRRWGYQRWSSVLIAIVVSQVLFALAHIPNDIAIGRSLHEILDGQIPRLILGLMFAILFLLSNNLFLVVGLHALHNAPISLEAGVSFRRSPNILLLSILIYVAISMWQLCRKRWEAHGEMSKDNNQ